MQHEGFLVFNKTALFEQEKAEIGKKSDFFLKNARMLRNMAIYAAIVSVICPRPVPGPRPGSGDFALLKGAASDCY
ncbi:hypothetical protein ACFO3A_11350 [Comamonas nitrativorans]|uniref:Uncharacterized protein n=1 Tax=Comamonas nitrativorans TaxID=108437 RepID=A0ABV9GX88_9BURK